MPTTRIPVVFVHGLWTHADAWTPWVDLFEAAGYAPMNPGWPGHASTVAEARAYPERVAHLGIAEVTEHHARLIRSLGEKPIVIGHSLGGLIAQKLLGMGLASACVAIAPAQMRGVLPLPFAQLRTLLPLLGNPANARRAFVLTPEQYHRGFANALSREEADALHARYVIPSPGRPLFEVALANLDWKTAARVDLRRLDRGPLLIIGGGRDVMVPEVVTRAEYGLYRESPAETDYTVFGDRGHSLAIDHGWKTVAEVAIDWLATRRPRSSAAIGAVPPREGIRAGLSGPERRV